MTRPDVRVAYIAGAGRSGSTLLAMMLGTLPGWVSVGELRHLWARGVEENQLCGCGDTVFLNGGTVTQTRIDQTIRTAASNPTLYQTFNPFTTTPVQGVNWDYGPNFGKALNRFAYTSPRTVRIGFGVRF